MSFKFRFLFCLILANLSLVAQSTKEKKNLLWRITGKGLSQPSYLYGTIHLSDKRVFNFGDSLYAALERSEGYAMELNPDSLMIDYFEERDDKESVVYVKDVLDKALYAKAKKKLSEKLKKPADKITVKDLKTYHNAWVYLMNSKTSMQTFMDAYLYNASKKAGKWVGGIEDVSDQKSERENTSVEFYVDEILNDNRQSKQVMEKLVGLYISEDLEELENFFFRYGRWR